MNRGSTSGLSGGSRESKSSFRAAVLRFSIRPDNGAWGTYPEPPAEWREIENHVVFAFSNPNNWDVSNVDFTVGGADPQDFYQTDVWGGLDPQNGEGRSREEMPESYRGSCKREIRNLIGNAVPKNF